MSTNLFNKMQLQLKAGLVGLESTFYWTDLPHEQPKTFLILHANTYPDNGAHWNIFKVLQDEQQKAHKLTKLLRKRPNPVLFARSFLLPWNQLGIRLL